MQSAMWLATVGLCGVLLAGCGGGDDPTPTPTPAPAPAPVTPTPAPAPAPVQGAWDNHLGAFGAGVTAGSTDGADKTAALDKIMLDYTEQSIVRVFNNDQPDLNVTTHVGIDAIREMFNMLFTTLNGCNDDKADNLRLPADQAQPVVTETNGDSPGSVFLLWQCKSARVNFATDTFIFTGNKIAAQNIVISMPAASVTQAADTPSGSYSAVGERRLQAYAPADVSEAWTNHATAFIDQNLDQIMLDYTDESTVLTFEWTNPVETLNTHNGTAAIRALFTGLFATISNNTVGFPAGDPVVTQRMDTDAIESSVFLNWNAVGAGIAKATDTFIFGQDLKIKTQTVVTVSDPSRLEVLV